MRKLKIAIIGYGGIARVHNSAYARLASEGACLELCAVCERDPSRIHADLKFNLGNENVELPEGTAIFTDVDELISGAEFDVADICLPTYLHKDVAIKLMRAKKHVICEKPMALSFLDCEEMIRVSRESGVQLMIAHCLRFDSAYRYLYDSYKDGRFGALDNLYLDRHSIYPTWGGAFGDNTKTGGCTLDTHIHDLDFALHLLGTPDYVSAVEFNNPPHYQVVTSTLHFGDTTVIANGSWDSAYEKQFECGYRARFERASITFDGTTVNVIPVDGEPYCPTLSGPDRTDAELSYFADTVCGAENTVCPPESSASGVRLVELLRQSATQGGAKIRFDS